MTFPRVPSSRRAWLLGLATASGLGLTIASGGASAQSTAAPSAPATTVPPAATPAVPPAATTSAPAEVQAPSATASAPAGSAPPAMAESGKPRREHHHGSNGMNVYLAALHDELKVTPAEEPLWTSFADSMRDSAAQLGAAYRQRRDQLPTMNALQDMNSFIDLEQMRLDGLKKSSAAFSALYQAMPADQQKVADTVFLSDMPGAPRHKKPKADK
jgi:hypothetical protein